MTSPFRIVTTRQAVVVFTRSWGQFICTLKGKYPFAVGPLSLECRRPVYRTRKQFNSIQFKNFI